MILSCVESGVIPLRPPSPVQPGGIEELRRIVRLRAAPSCLVERAGLVLSYLEAGSLRETARRCGSAVSTVRRWVERWKAKPSIESLSDLQRTGRKRTFDLRTTVKVLSIVSQSPEEYGFSTVMWTQELLVEELKNQGITVSRSTVQRILARQDIDVRTVKYWLHTPRDRPNYIERRDAICDLYLGMNSLPDDEIVIVFDAKPGIQILGDPKNNDGHSWPRPGQPRRVEFEYRRLGTRSLVAAVSPATGEVMHFDLYDKSRRFDSGETIDFLDALRFKLNEQGFRRIHLVLDNGSTHTSKATTAYFEKHAQTFTTYFTPVHASWLNLCENFFSTFSRRYLKHRRSTSVDEFVARVPSWIDDHNRRCNPLRWTYAPHQRAA